MQAPLVPDDEIDRQSSLDSLNILDTDSEERFDRITRIAKKLLDVDIVLISLVDRERQWFKSKVGITVDETPREYSFCGHAILSDNMFFVGDASKDKRFSDNPLVAGDPHIRMYAAKPLKGPGQHNVGTLCAIDSAPREFTPEEIEVLEDLGHWAQLELNSEKLSHALTELNQRYDEVQRLNKVMVDREMKMIELKAQITELKSKLAGLEGS